MARPGLHIPVVVYNTGGYETPEAVAALRGYGDIWLADVKYRSPELSAEYSNAPDYFEAARIAVKAMIAQAGPPVLDGQGTDAQRLSCGIWHCRAPRRIPAPCFALWPKNFRREAF